MSYDREEDRLSIGVPAELRAFEVGGGGSAPTSTPVILDAGSGPIRPPGFNYSKNFFNQFLPQFSGMEYPGYNRPLDPGMSPTMQNLLRMSQGFATSPGSSVLQGAEHTLGQFMGGSGMNIGTPGYSPPQDYGLGYHRGQIGGQPSTNPSLRPAGQPAPGGSGGLNPSFGGFGGFGGGWSGRLPGRDPNALPQDGGQPHRLIDNSLEGLGRFAPGGPPMAGSVVQAAYTSGQPAGGGFGGFGGFMPGGSGDGLGSVTGSAIMPGGDRPPGTEGEGGTGPGDPYPRPVPGSPGQDPTTGRPPVGGGPIPGDFPPGGPPGQSGGAGFGPWQPYQPINPGTSFLPWAPGQPVGGSGREPVTGGSSFIPPGGAGPGGGAPPGDAFGPTSVYDVFRQSVPVMNRAIDQGVDQAVARSGLGGTRYSSATANDAARVGGDAALALSRDLSGRLYDATQSGLDRSLQSAMAAPGIAGAMDEQTMNRLRLPFQFGQYEQGRQDQFSGQAFNDWSQNRLGFLPMLLNAAMNPGSGGSAGQPPTYGQFQSGGGSSGFSDFMSWAGPIIAAGIASDERLKSEIADPELPEDLPLRPREFVMDGERRLGFVAQEIERVDPRLVTEFEGVKYLRLDGIVATVVAKLLRMEHRLAVLEGVSEAA